MVPAFGYYCPDNYILFEKRWNAIVFYSSLCFVNILTGPYGGEIDKISRFREVFELYKKSFLTSRKGIFIGVPFMYMGMIMKKQEKYFRKIFAIN